MTCRDVVKSPRQGYKIVNSRSTEGKYVDCHVGDIIRYRTGACYYKVLSRDDIYITICAIDDENNWFTECVKCDEYRRNVAYDDTMVSQHSDCCPNR